MGSSPARGTTMLGHDRVVLSLDYKKRKKPKGGEDGNSTFSIEQDGTGFKTGG